MLAWDDFVKMYHTTIYDEQIGRQFFKYSADKSRVTFRELQAFFYDEQKETALENLSRMVWDFITHPGRDPRQPILTMQEVCTCVVIVIVYMCCYTLINMLICFLDVILTY